AAAVEQECVRSCWCRRVTAHFHRAGNFSLLVVEKNAAAISLGTSHSLRSESNAGAWVCARPARSSIAAGCANHDCPLRRVGAGERTISILEHRQRRELGVGALGIALRATGFARDRRCLLCGLYDEVGAANRLDC